MLKVRLARFGRTKRPFYWIVLAPSTNKRDSFIKKLGTYDPFSKQTTICQELITYYISKGAHPTERVKKILSQAEKQ